MHSLHRNCIRSAPCSNLKPLCLLEGITGGLMTITGMAPANVHMTCSALVVGIVHAFLCLTVDTDGIGRVTGRVAIRIFVLSHQKTLATGLVTAACILSAHADIAFAAQMILVVGAAFSTAFQISHIFPPFRYHKLRVCLGSP